MRKLEIADKERMLTFLNENSAANLFIIGDLEMFGFDDKIQSFYGEEHDGVFTGIIMRFKDISLCAYITAPVSDAFLAKVAELIEKYNPLHINIEGGTYDLVDGKLDVFCEKIEKTTLAVFAPNNLKVDTSKVVRLDVSYAEQIARLQSEVFDRPASETIEDAIIKMGARITSQETRVYGIVENGIVQSVGEVTAESSSNGMIIGVGTRMDARKKGYATQVVRKICDDLLAEDKRAVLFYTNPIAAKIYLSLGFEPTDAYYMMKIK